MLLVNPTATTTNRRTRDVLIRALGAAVDLTVEETRYRGHAAVLASGARSRGFDAVAVLGGDGTINEAVNGLLTPRDDTPPADASPGGPAGTAAGSTPEPGDTTTGPEDGAEGRPELIVIPGGGANVFARALGLPNNPVEATSVVLEALQEGRRRTVGLGQARWGEENRYFTFCAGLGYDAEVIRAIEGLRGAGFKATPARYVSTTVRHYFATDRRHPALTLEGPGVPVAQGMFMAIISNTSPWTYLGDRPVRPTPWASFDTGLDLLGLRRMGLPSMMRLLPQVLSDGEGPITARHLVQLHDEAEFTLTANRPVAFQLDGDYLGECEKVEFRSVPNALQIVA